MGLDAYRSGRGCNLEANEPTAHHQQSTGFLQASRDCCGVVICTKAEYAIKVRPRSAEWPDARSSGDDQLVIRDLSPSIHGHSFRLSIDCSDRYSNLGLDGIPRMAAGAPNHAVGNS